MDSDKKEKEADQKKYSWGPLWRKMVNLIMKWEELQGIKLDRKFYQGPMIITGIWYFIITINILIDYDPLITKHLSFPTQLNLVQL
jgi:hypothetical protein